MSLKNRNIESEFSFIASRSSGKGGQYVNKVSTKVELNFDIRKSSVLTAEEKDIICSKLANKMDKRGVLHVISQHKRSQMLNKISAVNRMLEILEEALKPEKKRIKTKVSKLVKEKRLETKKIISVKKKMRKRDYDL